MQCPLFFRSQALRVAGKTLRFDQKGKRRSLDCQKDHKKNQIKPWRKMVSQWRGQGRMGNRLIGLRNKKPRRMAEAI
jgi:hypothetical protein